MESSEPRLTPRTMTSPEQPLLRREMLALLRGRRGFWLLVLGVAVSSLVPLLSWPAASRAARLGSGNAQVVATFLLTQLAVVLVTVSASMASAITGERDRGTWESLVSTPLSPAAIVLAKLGA